MRNVRLYLPQHTPTAPRYPAMAPDVPLLWRAADGTVCVDQRQEQGPGVLNAQRQDDHGRCLVTITAEARRLGETAEQLADAAALALVQCRALAEEAETARQAAAAARDAAAAALADAGWTVRRIGAELDVSHTLAHKMIKAHQARVWGQFEQGYSATPSLSQLAEEYRLARHAQELRAEAAGGLPGNEEWRGFFGDESVARAENVEAPLVWGSWLKHRSQMTGEG